MDSFRALIGLWESRSIFASDVGETAMVVSAWVNRDSIPAAKFSAVVDAAQKRGVGGVTYEALAHLAAKRQANLKHQRAV